MTLALLAFSVVAPLLAVRLVAWLSRRVVDGEIDALIRANSARSRPGMEGPDWRKIESIGARNAEAVWQAEWRQAQAPRERVH